MGGRNLAQLGGNVLADGTAAGQIRNTLHLPHCGGGLIPDKLWGHLLQGPFETTEACCNLFFWFVALPSLFLSLDALNLFMKPKPTPPLPPLLHFNKTPNKELIVVWWTGEEEKVFGVMLWSWKALLHCNHLVLHSHNEWDNWVPNNSFWVTQNSFLTRVCLPRSSDAPSFDTRICTSLWSGAVLPISYYT